MNPSIFVTGAGSGLGQALAIEAGKRGWRVGLCGRHENRLAAVAEEVSALGGQVEVFELDVVDHEALQEAINTFKPKSLVCCAAVLHQALLNELTPELFSTTMAINVQGTFNACRAAMIGWQTAGVAGDIVNVSSLGGLRGQQRFTGFVAYAASKHAVVGLTEALAQEGRPYNVRVNAIAPGGFDTGMSRALGLKATTSASAIVPTIFYLLDRAQSGPITGSTIEMPCNDN